MNTEKTGDLIKELRKEKNLTQAQLAEQMNVSPKAISRWETGRGFPDIGNLECLAGILGVSTAELIGGERFQEAVTAPDASKIADDTFSVARDYVNKRKWLNLLIGFLTGAILMLLAAAHLFSPIPITDPDNALSIMELPDGQVAVSLNKKAAGYEIEEYKDPDSSEPALFVSCYETQWSRLTGKQNRLIISLGQAEDLSYVYYYPCSNGSDRLIWQNESLPAPGGGVQTMNRLVYNMWLFIGIGLTAIGAVLCFLLRKKYYFEWLLKAVVVPAVFTVSIALNLIGHFGTVYDAPYYFTGILLTALLLYLLFLAVYEIRKDQRKVRQ